MCCRELRASVGHTGAFQVQRKSEVGEEPLARKEADVRDLRRLPFQKRGRRNPWEVLCDNAAFLTSVACQRERARARVTLWSILARSPDLNPVELFWAWLRKKLRSMDLADAIAKKPVLGKMAYRARVVRVLKTTKAQTVAANIAKGFRRTCKRIVECKGRGVKG